MLGVSTASSNSEPLVPHATLRLAALALALITTPLLAGPPWISIEIPANPLDRTTRGALLLVHSYHHADPTSFPITGTAEGLVNGERRSVPLAFERTSRPGVYALRNQWGETGDWTLVITVTQAQDDVAQAMVRLSGSRVLGVTVPTRADREGAFPRRITAQEIEASLRQGSGPGR